MSGLPVNIVIDSRWITPTPSGIGVYTKELISRLPALEPSWKWHFLFKDRKLMEDTARECGFADNPKVSCVLLGYGPFSPKNQLLLPVKLRELSCDIFHSTNYMLPYLAFGSFLTPLGLDKSKDKFCGDAVTTIHDVIPLILKEYAPRSRTSKMKFLFRALLKASIRSSKAVITGSETSRRDMAQVLNLSTKGKKNIHTIYDGVSDKFGHIDGTVQFQDNGGKTPVILYVGRLDPYKNVPMLVDAFAKLVQSYRKPLHLLIVGPDDPRYRDARRHAEMRGLAQSVTFLGDATDDELLSAYKSAFMLVNPSRYEGFGLPMLEAMKCGIPVVCADGGSQREISGGAAIVVPPNDEEALVEAMERVLSRPDLRQKMIEEGRKRAAFFTWEKTAEETIGLYRAILGSKRTQGSK